MTSTWPTAKRAVRCSVLLSPVAIAVADPIGYLLLPRVRCSDLPSVVWIRGSLVGDDLDPLQALPGIVLCLDDGMPALAQPGDRRPHRMCQRLRQLIDRASRLHASRSINLACLLPGRGGFRS
jgi:hypothetical protein